MNEEIVQQLKIKNMINLLQLTMRPCTRTEMVEIIAKIEENPDKKFSELVDEILEKKGI